MSGNRTLLILDLDETLIHATSQLLSHEPDFRVFTYGIYKRPHLDAFLEFSNANFDLAIWSSASDDYVKAVVESIVPVSIPLKFVWGRSRCTPKSNALYEYSYDWANHYKYTKQFKKIKKQGYDLRRVLIVDDTPSKVANSYGNAIYIKEFNGEPDDQELTHLMAYLETIKDLDNVRILEKRGWRSNQITG